MIPYKFKGTVGGLNAIEHTHRLIEHWKRMGPRAVTQANCAVVIDSGLGHTLRVEWSNNRITNILVSTMSGRGRFFELSSTTLAF